MKPFSHLKPIYGFLIFALIEKNYVVFGCADVRFRTDQQVRFCYRITAEVGCFLEISLTENRK